MAIQLNDVTEKRFLEDICASHVPNVANAEAHVLFSSIQAAFTRNFRDEIGESIMVRRDMVSHLAACAWVALGYSEKDSIPWDTGLHDDILPRVLRYFMSTLRDAIKEGRTYQINGNMMHGCFVIPQWFYHQCLEGARVS